MPVQHSIKPTKNGQAKSGRIARNFAPRDDTSYEPPIDRPQKYTATATTTTTTTEESGHSADFDGDGGPAPKPKPKKKKHVKPAAEDTERQFVANMLASPPDVATITACRVSGDWFDDAELGAVWQSIYGIVRRGEHVSPKQILSDAPPHALPWSAEDLCELVAEADGEPVLDYAKALREREKTRILSQHFSTADAIREALEQIALIDGTTAGKADLGRPWGELIAKPKPIEWLVEGVLRTKMLTAVAAPKKTLKTAIMADLAISLETGTKFLDHFKVCRRHKVGYFIGESQEDFDARGHAIATARGIDPATIVGVRKYEHCPILSTAAGLEEIRRGIGMHGFDVVVIDSLYFAIDGSAAEQAGNIFIWGAIVAPLLRMCDELGVTIILIHHFGKARTTNEIPDLDDMAYSGLPAAARQWVLLSRRKKYEYNGYHHLWMQCGGGRHGNAYGLVVNEGTAAAEWEVTVQSQVEVIEKQSEDVKAAQDGLDLILETAVMEALAAAPGGLLLNGIRDATGWGADKAKRVLLGLCKKGKVIKEEVKGGMGKLTSLYKLAPQEAKSE